MCVRVCVPTLEVGELQVVVVQRQVVLHWREAARPRGEVPDALMLTVQNLSEVICTHDTFLLKESLILD